MASDLRLAARKMHAGHDLQMIVRLGRGTFLTPTAAASQKTASGNLEHATLKFKEFSVWLQPKQSTILGGRSQ